MLPAESVSLATGDYYTMLELTRSPKDVDIKKAYRKLALKYHPYKNDAPWAVEKFNDPVKKGVYDKFVGKGLKGGIPLEFGIDTPWTEGYVFHGSLLGEALIGCTIDVSTLDECLLNIPINGIVHPKYFKVVPGEGMPLSQDPTCKEDLFMDFDIIFPTRLTPAKKDLLREALLT
uniref:J domain-containing protein n=1 Tax=Anolis carolinensis TaxID=28377 RepID=A0A803TWB1_ANOCA